MAEHIVLAEAGLFAGAKTELAAPAFPDWEARTEGKTKIIKIMMAPRMGKATAPEPLVPGGKMTRVEVLRRFEAQRAEMVKFVRETDAPLHTERHDKQIAEVKATAGYPK